MLTSEETPIIPINKDACKDIWVYIETADRVIKKVGLELLGEGKKMADKMGVNLAAILIGDNVGELIEEVFAYGADQAYVIESEVLNQYSTDGYTKVFTGLIKKFEPSVILMGATHNGRDLAPRIASRIGTGLTADCTDLDIDEVTGLVAWTLPTFGGNVMATIVCPEHRPQMGTVRQSVFKAPIPDRSRVGEVIRVKSCVNAEEIRTKIIDTIRTKKENCNLEEAEIIVSGGRGMGSAENFLLLENLAEVLGASVGASRAAVDEGWKQAPHMVGQTGKTVSPKIYFACGISGAMQHVAGMSASDVIIAINKDPDAPIFRVADYGIVGDVLELLPVLTRAFKRIKEPLING